MAWTRRVASVAVMFGLVMSGAGCTSMHPVAGVVGGVSSNGWGLKRGDRLELSLTDGSLRRIVVRGVEASAIAGMDNERYEVANIRSVRRRDPDTAKTLGLIGGIVAAFLVLMIGSLVAAGPGLGS